MNISGLLERFSSKFQTACISADATIRARATSVILFSGYAGVGVGVGVAVDTAVAVGAGVGVGLRVTLQS